MTLKSVADVALVVAELELTAWDTQRVRERERERERERGGGRDQ